MRTIKFFLAMMFAVLISGSLSAQATSKLKSESFKTLGNCGMCKTRIESAAKSAGASTVSWNVKTKMLAVSFDPAKTSRAAIEKKTALAGHDTEKLKAEDKVYNSLPGCCKYERTAQANKMDHSSHGDHSGHSH